MRRQQLAVFIAGFSAMAGQVLLSRELLVAFFGNEFTLGLALSMWMLATAAGSIAGARLVPAVNDREKAFILRLIIADLLLVAGVVCARSLRMALSLSPGQIIPLFPSMVCSFLAVGPACFFFGTLFPLACSFSGDQRWGFRVYSLEALGAASGGVFFFLIAARMDAVALLFLLLLAAALCGIFFRVPETVAAAAAISMVLGVPRMIELSSLQSQWKGFRLIASVNSIYGNVAVTARGRETTFFGNGMRLFTIPDEQTEEESVQFCLLEHPGPRSVLLIGGSAGAVRQAAGDGARVSYVEIDPLVISLQKRMPSRMLPGLSGPGVSVNLADGRRFVKSARGVYDCVIVNSSDPLSLQLNRYFTVEFFREVSAVLSGPGILCVSVSSSEQYLGREARDYLGSVYATLSRVFPDVKVIPGETAYLLACNQRGVLTYDYRLLERRAGERGLRLKFVASHYLSSRLDPFSLKEYEKAVTRSAANAAVNSDLRPSGCLYALGAWTSRFGERFVLPLIRIAEKGRYAFFTVLCVLAALSALLNRRSPAIFCAAAGGFSMIGIQTLILLGFQSLYGYVFHAFAAIMAFFMLGMALGGSSDRGGEAKASVIRLLAATAFLSLLPPLVVTLLSKAGQDLSWRIGPVVLTLALPSAAGAVCGAQFPALTRLFAPSAGGRAPGLIYGGDLAGSSCGALLACALFVPVLGMSLTAVFCSFLSLCALLILLKKD